MQFLEGKEGGLAYVREGKEAHRLFSGKKKKMASAAYIGKKGKKETLRRVRKKGGSGAGGRDDQVRKGERAFH